MSIINRLKQIIIINRTCKLNLNSFKYYSTEETKEEGEQQEGFIFLIK